MRKLILEDFSKDEQQLLSDLYAKLIVKDFVRFDKRHVAKVVLRNL